MENTLYFTKLNLRSYARQNIDAWNDCIEDLLYIKYLILSCNGRTIKKEEEKNYISRIRNSSISPFSRNSSETSRVTTEIKKKDFDLINRNKCRKWFKPSEIAKDKKYLRGEIHPEMFKPLLSKQSYFTTFDDNTLNKHTIRELTYHNIFELCLPEKYLIGAEGARSINLKFIDWNRDLWVHMFPTFYVDKIDIRTVNNLIALYCEVIKNNGLVKDNVVDNNIWIDIDEIVNNIETFTVDENGFFDLSNGNVYFTMSKLLSGNPMFYYGLVREPKQPLISMKFNTYTDGLKWAFEHFEAKHFHEIRTLAYNFLEDPIGIDIKLNSVGSFFLNPDNKIDLLIKIFNGIINHSKKEDYYLKLRKLADLYFVISDLPDEIIQTPDEVEENDQFSVLKSRQSTLLSTFGICMLVELFYSDRIKVINGQFLDNEIYELYDKLLYTASECLKKEFNGINNIEGCELFEFYGLKPTNEHKPYYKNRFISHIMTEKYISEPGYKNELFKVSYVHNLILPTNKVLFPKTCCAVKELKQTKKHTNEKEVCVKKNYKSRDKK